MQNSTPTCGYLVCGEALIDLVPVEADGQPMMRALCGGSPYNVAIGLARLGAETHFLGRLSRDANGARLLRRLEDNGVRTGYVAQGDAPTTLAYVFPPEEGRKDVGYAFYVEGTSGAALHASDFPASLPERIRIVHFGSFAALLPGSGEMIREFAARCGRLVSYDPNIRPTITPNRAAVREKVAACMSVADIIKLSDADAAWLYPGAGLQDVATNILTLGPSVVAITRGAEGALVQGRMAAIALPGVPVTVADTVGAGDTFMAALLREIGRLNLADRSALDGASDAQMEEAVSFACRAAAIVCGRHGAEPPHLAELENPAG